MSGSALNTKTRQAFHQALRAFEDDSERAWGDLSDKIKTAFSLLDFHVGTIVGGLKDSPATEKAHEEIQSEIEDANEEIRAAFLNCGWALARALKALKQTLRAAS